MNENERKAYLDFMYNSENVGNCNACPENRGEDGHEANGHPCGQQSCWVALHCARAKIMSKKDSRGECTSWLGKLNGGQLDLMWQFLQFHGDKPTVKEIEALEENLDHLRVMMVQKNGGREGRNAKTQGAVDFADMETVLNNIVIETMWLYLGGGLKMLKDVIQNELL